MYQIHSRSYLACNLLVPRTYQWQHKFRTCNDYRVAKLLFRIHFNVRYEFRRKIKQAFPPRGNMGPSTLRSRFVENERRKWWTAMIVWTAVEPTSFGSEQAGPIRRYAEGGVASLSSTVRWNVRTLLRLSPRRSPFYRRSQKSYRFSRRKWGRRGGSSNGSSRLRREQIDQHWNRNPSPKREPISSPFAHAHENPSESRSPTLENTNFSLATSIPWNCLRFWFLFLPDYRADLVDFSVQWLMEFWSSVKWCREAWEGWSFSFSLLRGWFWSWMCYVRLGRQLQF